MLCHLEKERGYTIENPEEGVYYVIGDKIPIQVIVISQLNPKKNYLNSPSAIALIEDAYSDGVIPATFLNCLEK